MVVLEDEAKASDLLVFAIDGVRYGLPADDVVELTRSVAISPLPEARQVHLVEGLINFHGELAAAINLRSRFGHPHRALSPSEHFIFSRAGRHLLALRVDKVHELVSAPVEALDVMKTGPSSRSAQGAGGDDSPFAGVCKLSDGLVFIFDLKTFLSKSESAAVEEIIRAAQVRQQEESDK